MASLLHFYNQNQLCRAQKVGLILNFLCLLGLGDKRNWESTYSEGWIKINLKSFWAVTCTYNCLWSLAEKRKRWRTTLKRRGNTEKTKAKTTRSKSNLSRFNKAIFYCTVINHSSVLSSLVYSPLFHVLPAEASFYSATNFQEILKSTQPCVCCQELIYFLINGDPIYCSCLIWLKFLLGCQGF